MITELASTIATIDIETWLARSGREVWADVTTARGINRELGPWLRMTVPAPLREATLSDLEVGTTIGRSWILLLGLVPVDYDDLGLSEIGDGYFHERSTMATATEWHHERWVTDECRAGRPGCVVKDRVRFVSRPWLRRVPGAAALHEGIITAVFRHRHRRLAAAYP